MVFMHPHITGELTRLRTQESIRAAAATRLARAARPPRRRLTALMLIGARRPGPVAAGPQPSPSLATSGTKTARRTSTRPWGRGKEQAMSLFIDMHTMDGPVGLDDVAKAHQADLGTQAKYGVNYLRYWVDEEHGKIFCLVEAPDADTAAAVHREAHGLTADHIYPVAEGI